MISTKLMILSAAMLGSLVFAVGYISITNELAKAQKEVNVTAPVYSTHGNHAGY